jgi:biotin synthase
MNSPRPSAEALADPHSWTPDTVLALFDLPFADLLFRAQQVHRAHFDPNEVQTSTLLSIKTGGCPEDCGYCSQSVHHETGLARETLLPKEAVIEAAARAKAAGATRFCMGAAWRGPKDADVERVADLVSAVRDLGLETCATLGMLKPGQAERLRAAGLDYYNHNLDTSSDHYDAVVSTHTYADRLDTLAKVRGAGIKVCCGGILGLGETRAQRAAFIAELANLDPAPESVPINVLVPIAGTPLESAERCDPLDLVRTVAAARIAMPTSFVRLSAGRTGLTEAAQALCFLAGANSVFYGDRLLTTDNRHTHDDDALFAKLGLRAMRLAGEQDATGPTGCATP